MNTSLREQVRRRADGRCEYCQLPEAATELPHEADHIRAVKHGGATVLENLAWACARCNDYKGSDVSAFVPDTDELVWLFNPRTDLWQAQFFWNGPVLVGRTPIAQATLSLLKINSERRIHFRKCLMDDGIFVPTTASNNPENPTP